MVRKSRAAALEEFYRLYRAGNFFDAHEVLEDAWRVETGAVRQRLHGLIHGAVARHHHEKGNAEGAARQSARAHARLKDSAEDAGFLSELAEAVAPSVAALDAGGRARLRQLERLLEEKMKAEWTKPDEMGQSEGVAESGSAVDE